MIATPFSKEPYYPMLLTNGQDGIAVNYTGTNVCPSSGHGFFGETLGVPCGWYKSSSRAVNGITVEQIIRAGIEVELYGSSCMPNHYEQAFIAKEGILRTKLTFAKKVHVTVEAFLTDDGLWGEKISVDKCPKDLEFKLGFSLLRTFSGYAWTNLLRAPSMEASESERVFSFTYTLDQYKGMGALWASEAFETVSHSKDFFHGTTGKVQGFFKKAEEGDIFSRILTCVDESECDDIHAEFKRREEKARMGYEAVKEIHTASYKQRNTETWVQVPDERLQGLYDISRYNIDGNYNRQTGAISLGLLPHLWGGGLHCSYDGVFIISALMKAGNVEAAEKYKEFFLSQGEIGKKALASIGVEGTAFTGWTNAKGEFARLNKELAYWLISDKPMFHLCEIIMRYIVWKYTERTLDEETERIVRDAVSFVEERLLRKIDGRYHLIDVQSGTENNQRVEADTSTIVMLASAFKGVAEMLHMPRYAQIAEEVLLDLAGNYREDGVLMPYKDAPYTSGGQMDYYIFTLPKPIDILSVDKALEAGKTPWGYTFEQTTEEKQHWPWIHSRAAICYAHEGRSEQAMEHLLSMPNKSSSLSALPEYLRIDGLPVNYWYTTSHALAVWAVHDAFAHIQNDTLRLLFGMTDAWQNFSCRKLHLDRGLMVTLRVENGMLHTVELYNKTDEDICLNLSVNSAFCPKDFPTECIVRAKEVFIYER